LITSTTNTDSLIYKYGNFVLTDSANVTGATLGREEQFTSCAGSPRGVSQNLPPRAKAARTRKGPSPPAAAAAARGKGNQDRLRRRRIRRGEPAPGEGGAEPGGGGSRSSPA